MTKYLLVALTFATQAILGADALSDLKDIKCLYYQNLNDDPRISIEFTHTEDLSDFVHVTISKRMTDSDESWKVVSESDEQIMINDRYYSIGIDDTVILIKRPVPGWNKAKHPNGTLEFRDQGKTYKLRCENIKN